MTNVWTEVEAVKVVLQIVTILVGGIGLGIAIRQLRLVYVTYRDLHDWNRRKAALDAADKAAEELGEDTPLLHEKFGIMSTNEEISVEQNSGSGQHRSQSTHSATQTPKNFLETVAIGVDEGVLDESVIKRVFEQVFYRTLSQFKSYANYRQRSGFIDSWTVLESSLEVERRGKRPPQAPRNRCFCLPS